MCLLPPWRTITAAHSAANATGIVHREVNLTDCSSIARWLNLQCTALCVRCVRAYRITFSLLFVGSCRFEPSCSHYAEEAVQRHGCVRGLWFTVCRLGRCQPFHAGGYDPVPGGPGPSLRKRACTTGR